MRWFYDFFVPGVVFVCVSTTVFLVLATAFPDSPSASRDGLASDDPRYVIGYMCGILRIYGDPENSKEVADLPKDLRDACVVLYRKFHPTDRQLP